MSPEPALARLDLCQMGAAPRPHNGNLIPAGTPGATYARPIVPRMLTSASTFPGRRGGCISCYLSCSMDPQARADANSRFTLTFLRWEGLACLRFFGDSHCDASLARLPDCRSAGPDSADSAGGSGDVIVRYGIWAGTDELRSSRRTTIWRYHETRHVGHVRRDSRAWLGTHEACDRSVRNLFLVLYRCI